MNLTSARNRELQKIKDKLLNDLKKCDEDIIKAKEIKRYIEFSSSDSSDPEFDVNYVDEWEEQRIKERCHLLKVRMKATAELSKLDFKIYKVDVLSQPPIDVDDDAVNEKFSGSWKQVTASCVVGSIAFDISFAIHKPASIKACVTYHNLHINITKPTVCPILTVGLRHVHQLPASAIALIRRYDDLLRERKSKLKAKISLIKEQNIVVTEDATGGCNLQKRNGTVLLWKISVCLRPFIYFYHDINVTISRGDSSQSSMGSVSNRLQDPDILSPERNAELSRVLNSFLGTSNVNLPVVEPSDGTEEENESESTKKFVSPKKKPESPKKKTAPKQTKKTPKNPKKAGTAKSSSKITGNTSQSTVTSSKSRIPISKKINK